MSQFFASGGQSIGTSASASVLLMNIQIPMNNQEIVLSFRIDWLDLLASPRDSQVSSPAPQFENINSSALSLLYGATLTSIHDYWKNHSFD